MASTSRGVREDYPACPQCSGPLAAGEVSRGKGGDWRWLECPACGRSFKWRPTRLNIGMRMVVIAVAVVYLLFVPIDDTFAVILVAVALAMIVWAIVTLILTWRTAASWKRRGAA
jgi:hypothetical protein